MKVAGKEVGERPLILAPMEDVTNPPFRKFCKQYGADWLYSEFVSADALVRSVNKSLKKLTIDDSERPVTIQIYGFYRYKFRLSGEEGSAKGSRSRNVEGCTLNGGDDKTDCKGGKYSRNGENPAGMG